MNRITLPEFTEEQMRQMHLKYYEDIKNSPNNFSYWFPKIKDCGIPVPESVIIPLPMDIMDSLLMEKDGDRERLRDFINDKVMPAIPEDFGDTVFLKNGAFSNKFQFHQCHPKRTPECIFTSIVNISADSICFDTGGNAEIVIRRFIGENDTSYTETIYEGMRLRPEIRVFFDFESERTLYSVNYWDWDYCHEMICRDEHDKEIYERLYPQIDKFIKESQQDIEDLLNRKMKDTDLRGIWSVDLMYAEEKWWIIDMAVGHRSAYWDPERIKKALM